MLTFYVEISVNFWDFEVKFGLKTKMTSMKIFMKEKKTLKGICISQNAFKEKDNIIYVPFYAVEALPEIYNKYVEI